MPDWKSPRPLKRFLLLVAALDLRLLVTELLEERNILPRGLAHAVSFTGRGRAELGGRTPGLVERDDMFNPITSGDFQQFGAVEVTPRNYYRLLESGQNVLLYPGGAKEALSKRTDYPLFWPDRLDFVRTAAKFNATIVPISSVGMADSVWVVAEPQEFLDSPIFGGRVRAFNTNASAGPVRTAEETPVEQVIGFPLAFPKMPARNYFLFGTPIRLTKVDPKDKKACAQVYDEARGEVERGLADLARVRKHDPFRSTPRRMGYERIFGTTAPTFPIDKLNRP